MYGCADVYSANGQESYKYADFGRKPNLHSIYGENQYSEKMY